MEPKGGKNLCVMDLCQELASMVKDVWTDTCDLRLVMWLYFLGFCTPERRGCQLQGKLAFAVAVSSACLISTCEKIFCVNSTFDPKQRCVPVEPWLPFLIPLSCWVYLLQSPVATPAFPVFWKVSFSFTPSSVWMYLKLLFLRDSYVFFFLTLLPPLLMVVLVFQD